MGMVLLAVGGVALVFGFIFWRLLVEAHAEEQRRRQLEFRQLAEERPPPPRVVVPLANDRFRQLQVKVTATGSNTSLKVDPPGLLEPEFTSELVFEGEWIPSPPRRDLVHEANERLAEQIRSGATTAREVVDTLARGETVRLPAAEPADDGATPGGGGDPSTPFTGGDD